MSNKDEIVITPEIEAKIPAYIDKAVKNLYNGVEYDNWKFEYTEEYVEYLYKLSGYEHKPVVVVANSPKEYTRLYNLMWNPKVDNTMVELVLFQWDVKNGIVANDEKAKARIAELQEKVSKIPEIPKKVAITASNNYLFLASEYSRIYLLWYKIVKDEVGKATDKAAEIDWLYEKVNAANISKIYTCEKVALVLRMPKFLKKNDDGFHSTDKEGALYYNDDEQYFFLNGRNVPRWIFDDYYSGKLTFKKFIKQENEEDRAAIITLIKEKEGIEGVKTFLGAKLVDEAQVEHSCGRIETLRLYKTVDKYSFLQDRFGNTDQPYTFFEETCPSTGQVYLLDSCSSFTSALDAAKFHRPKLVSVDVAFDWEQFAN